MDPLLAKYRRRAVAFSVISAGGLLALLVAGLLDLPGLADWAMLLTAGAAAVGLHAAACSMLASVALRPAARPAPMPTTPVEASPRPRLHLVA